MGAGYHFGRTDSEAFNGDFDQHAFNLNFGMALTQKSMLNVGYRYFTTKTDGGNLDFNQHRIILGLSYNF
jgi:opacity protein-like surface antigen